MSPNSVDGVSSTTPFNRTSANRGRECPKYANDSPLSPTTTIHRRPVSLPPSIQPGSDRGSRGQKRTSLRHHMSQTGQHKAQSDTHSAPPTPLTGGGDNIDAPSSIPRPISPPPEQRTPSPPNSVGRYVGNQRTRSSEEVIARVCGDSQPSRPKRITEIIPDVLYFAAVPMVDGRPSMSPSHSKYHTLMTSYTYYNFNRDFGPLNLGVVHHFITEAIKLIVKDVPLYVIGSDRKPENAIVLLGCLLAAVFDWTPTQIARTFRHFHRHLRGYVDAGYGANQYTLDWLSVVMGFRRAVLLGWYHYESFDVLGYNYFSEIGNGDLNWIIPNEFVALSGPFDSHYDAMTREESYNNHPSKYLPIFNDWSVGLIIRLNSKQYSADDFRRAGVKHHDLYFHDGSCPAPSVIREFLSVSYASIREKKAVAVHCKAGLGRTGTLIGIYAMAEYGFTAREWIGWNRICRPGSILGPQQIFLENVVLDDDVMKIPLELGYSPLYPQLTEFADAHWDNGAPKGHVDPAILVSLKAWVASMNEHRDNSNTLTANIRRAFGKGPSNTSHRDLSPRPIIGSARSVRQASLPAVLRSGGLAGESGGVGKPVGKGLRKPLGSPLYKTRNGVVIPNDSAIAAPHTPPPVVSTPLNRPSAPSQSTGVGNGKGMIARVQPKSKSPQRPRRHSASTPLSEPRTTSASTGTVKTIDYSARMTEQEREYALNGEQGQAEYLLSAKARSRNSHSKSNPTSESGGVISLSPAQLSSHTTHGRDSPRRRVMQRIAAFWRTNEKNGMDTGDLSSNGRSRSKR